MIAQASTTRKAGVAVLTAAVTGILIAGLVSHRGVPGQALTDVQFYPPAAGQCIDEADTTRTVDCAVPHIAQIVRAWNVWEKEVTATGFGDLKQICWQLGSAALQPLGLSRADPFAGAVPPAVWAPPPLTVDTDIVISALDATPGRGLHVSSNPAPPSPRTSTHRWSASVRSPATSRPSCRWATGPPTCEAATKAGIDCPSQ